VVQNPTYGQIPKGTPESVAAARKLRVKAQRKRRRNRTFAWFVALVMLGGVVTAGWFGYQAFQDDQEQLDADRAAAQADGSAGAPGALTPLGNQQAVNKALDDVNSGATAGAGGFLGAVEDAQSAVDGINGTEETQANPAASGLTVLDLRPEPVLRLGFELDSVGGYERHVIDGRRFAADSPAEFERFVALMQAQPQIDPQATTFEALPTLAPGEIGFAIVRDGDSVLQAIIVSSDPPIHVDYAP
jgi:hypothetical protein